MCESDSRFAVFLVVTSYESQGPCTSELSFLCRLCLIEDLFVLSVTNFEIGISTPIGTDIYTLACSKNILSRMFDIKLILILVG